MTHIFSFFSINSDHSYGDKQLEEKSIERKSMICPPVRSDNPQDLQPDEKRVHIMISTVDLVRYRVSCAKDLFIWGYKLLYLLLRVPNCR